MLSDQEATSIVQNAIVLAGGFNQEHDGATTLNQAGLKTGHQRDSFQRKVAREVGEHAHKVLSVGKVPNKASTTVADVQKFLKDEKNVVPLEGEEA